MLFSWGGGKFKQVQAQGKGTIFGDFTNDGADGASKHKETGWLKMTPSGFTPVPTLPVLFL